MDDNRRHHKPLNAALVGFSQKGKRLFSAIAENETICLKYIITDDGHHLSNEDRKLIQKIDNINIYCLSEIESLLKHDAIDIVLLASHSMAHSDIIRLCVTYQKPVLCDNYLGTNINELKTINTELKQTKFQAMILLAHRFDPALISLKEKLHRGDIGVPHVIKITNRLPLNTNGENAEKLARLKHISRHDIDLICHLTEEKLNKLSLMSHVSINEILKNQYGISCPLLTLQLTDGLTAVIDYKIEPEQEFDQRIEIFGDNGMLRYDNLSEARLQMICGKAQAHALPYWQFIERYRQSYRLALQAFIAYVQSDNTTSPASLDDALLSISIQQMVDKSYREKSLISDRT